jgi:transcription initiation factor TFIID subunit 5
MTGHRGPIQSLSFSAESSVLVSGGLDCTVRCWDVKSAGGEKTRNGMNGDVARNGVNGEGVVGLGGEKGSLPMGDGEVAWDEGNAT